MQGQKLMMMGTADEIVKAPEKGPVFVEDLPEEEQVVNVVRLEIHCHRKDSVMCHKVWSPHYHGCGRQDILI
jgi:hypothetical protein